MKRVFLHIAKFIGVFALLRRLTRDQARILCYHGGCIGDEGDYNPKLFCTSGQLRQRLDWLRANGFAAATLDEAANWQPGTRPGIPVAVTLDDGWYSSYRDLLPLLAEHGHRPALYLHTEVMEKGTPVVAVSLRYILWKVGARAASLHGFNTEIDGDWQLADPAQQRRLRIAAEAWLKAQPAHAIAVCLERFAVALGLSAAVLDLASRRFNYMTTEELRAAEAAGCSIELHGHVHEYVRGEPERNRANIDACRAHIVDAGLAPPRHYCYPSGSFDAQAAHVMRTAGVATATTCLPGLVSARRSQNRDDDARYFLPRFLDGGDVSMIEFEAEMSGMLQLLRALVRGRWFTAPAPLPAEAEPAFSSI
jgi:peptidoglycan/xylan/chitin deacetylase (PgdA/CDA1 family)